MIAPNVANERDSANANVVQVEACEATVGEKRKSGDAAITEDAPAIRGANKVDETAAPDSILADTTLPAKQQDLPSLPGPSGPVDSAGPTSPAGPTGPADQADLKRPATLEDLKQAFAPITAMIVNRRARAANSRLRPDQQWHPLQRELRQQMLPGGQLSAPPGALPPAGLIPLRGQQAMAEALHALSVHYGEQFASWADFEAFLQY